MGVRRAGSGGAGGWDGPLAVPEPAGGGVVSRFECDDCGLAAMDLPDGVEPEFIFEHGDDGAMRCQGCALRWENRR